MRFTYPDGSKPLDGYTIERGIGVGGFGEVYFALSNAGKHVALKRIQRNLDVELRGVRQCLNLKHVNLITLWDIRTCEANESWVVMEYVPGPSLRDVVYTYPKGMPEVEIKVWFSSTAAGVAYLHDQGIVHRDLKPGNIFCDEDVQVIKIGDYGLSKFISRSHRSGHTETVGTFHYMAPEIGKGNYGKEIDIYALGIVLFEMLTGDVPFKGESTQEIITRHLIDDPDLSCIPKKFRKVIGKCLRKDPKQRYRTVQSMVADLPWPEVAQKSEQIVRQNAIGSIGTPNTDTVQSQQASTQTGPTQTDQIHRLPPVIITSEQARNANSTNPDIVFGVLRDSAITKTTQPYQNDSFNSDENFPKSDSPDPIQVIRQSDYNKNPTNTPLSNSLADDSIESSDKKITPQTAGISLPEMEEPIAKALFSGWTQFLAWWNHANFSATIKIILLIIGGIVVVQNSTWLLAMVVSSTVLYLAYYLIRQWWLKQNSASQWQQKKAHRKSQISVVRQWLNEQPSMDRITDLIGSFLIAGLACIVLSLLGMTLSKKLVASDFESWSLYIWIVLTSIAGSWTILAISKAWELSRGNGWVRRGTLAAAGLGIGGLSYLSASSFQINLSELAKIDFMMWHTSDYVFRQIPLGPGFILFFAAIFGALRWWHNTDPFRRTRLSTLCVAFALTWAVILAHAFNIPLVPSCIFAVVVSVATQLASPWLHPSRIQQICDQQEMEASK